MLLKPAPAKIFSAVPVPEKTEAPPPAAAVAEKGFLPALALIGYILLFTRDVFGGAMRYYTDIHGLSFLWFVPDAAGAAFVILAMVHKAMRHEGVSSWLLPALWAVYSALGFLNAHSMVAVISAAKMILPVIFGLYAGEYSARLTRNRLIHWAFWGLTVGGVIASKAITFPWLNYQISTFGVARAATRQWWIENVARLAGFATDSTGAGTIIMVSCMFLLARARLALAMLLLLPSLYALYLTTSRTSLASFLFFFLVAGVTYKQRTFIARAFFLSAAAVAVGAPIILPLAASGFTFSDVPHALTSLMDRALNTWTNPWLYMIDQFPVGLLVGMGLGPVGYPSLFSPLGQTPVTVIDNFALSNILMFGIPGFFGIIKLIKDAWRRLHARDLAIAGALLLFSATIEGYGNSVFCIAFGIMFSPWRKHDAA